MTDRELLLDCLQRLNRCGLPYLLTGSMASNYWGIPRTTHDIDFVIQLSPSKVPQLTEVFREGFFIDEAAVRAAFQPPHQFNAIDTHSALKVDFWIPGSEPFDRERFTRRSKVTLFGVPAWIATAEDVILHKLLWDRLTPSDRQLGDAAGIVAVQGDALDLVYLRQWARQLGVEEKLAKLLDGTIQPKQT